MSHLHDLYKRRQRKNHQREDFLSTALSWLIQRDQRACRLLLDELGVEPPSDLSRRAVRTQVRLRGSRKKPDLLLQALSGQDTWLLYIECKLDLPVDIGVAAQVAEYQRLTGSAVALLCRESELPEDGDGNWSHVPYRGSWQGLIRKLRAASAQVDAHAVPNLRTEFVALAERFKVAPAERAPTDALIRRSVLAQTRVGSWETAMKRALQQALPEVGKKDPWLWELDGPLDGGWVRDNDPKGFATSGLCVRGEVQSFGGTPAISWMVGIYPSRKALKKHSVDAESNGWIEDEYGWWYGELSTSFVLAEPGNDVLGRVLEEAKQALAEDWHIELREMTHPMEAMLAGPVSGVIRDLASASLVGDWLAAEVDALRGNLKRHLNEQMPGLAHRSDRQHQKVFLAVERGAPREFGAWHELTADGASIIIWLWLGGKTYQQPLEESLSEFISALGLEGWWGASERGSRCFNVRVNAQPAGSLGDRVEDLCGEIASWITKHRKPLGIKGSEEPR